MSHRPYEPGLATAEVDAFVVAIFERWPGWRGLAALQPGDAGWEVVVEIESPTGDRTRTLGLFSADGEPSVGFGSWHTHLSLWSAGDEPASIDILLDLVEAIVSDRFVLVEDLPGDSAGHQSPVDLRVEGELEEYLTDPHTPRLVAIKTWSGQGDRTIDLRPPTLRTLFERSIRELEPDAGGWLCERGEGAAVVIMAVPPRHPAVGELEVLVDARELTVRVGAHHHCHFDPMTTGREGVAALADAADMAADFVHRMLGDQIVLTLGFVAGVMKASSTHDAGAKGGLDGAHRFDAVVRFLWSGPLS